MRRCGRPIPARISKLLIAALLLAGSAVPAAAQTAGPPVTRDTVLSYVPHRVYDARREKWTDLEAMIADVMRADVVFIGEQHDNVAGHRLQLAILQGLTRRRGNIVVALEMFERDVQDSLNSYLAGVTTERDFLASSRPWPRYRQDYRPLVELARSYKWPVIAANVPRRLASAVSKRGLSALDSLSARDRAFVAREVNCPRDRYYESFAETMRGMPSHRSDSLTVRPAEKEAASDRMYEAQCIKDETMAESIAGGLAMAAPGALVLHINGSFHSDYRLGAADRTIRRLPGERIVVLRFVPVADLDSIAVATRDISDYQIFTLAGKP